MMYDLYARGVCIFLWFAASVITYHSAIRREWTWAVLAGAYAFFFGFCVLGG